jgi:aspartate-semialdehyde dehydrogenase
LSNQSEQILSGKALEYDPKIFPRAIAFDCIPQIDSFLENGYTKEEMKMVYESRKILNEPNLLISATTVRVPVFIGHGESINAEFMEPMDMERALNVLSDSKLSPGVIVIDGVEKNSDMCKRKYPVTRDLLKSEYKDFVLVGRIRNDTTQKNTINLWCVSDNLRKGAATNSIQIAEEMLKLGYI